MTQEVKQQLSILAALQTTEIEIAKIEKALSGVDAKIEALGSQIKAYHEKLTAMQDQLEGLRKQYRDDEAETKTIEARILRNNEKLRAVKTNKEYQSMLKEIDELEKKRSEIEDRMLNGLEDIEQAEAAVVLLKKEMTGIQADIEQQQVEIRSRAQNEGQALEQHRKERDDIFARLDPALKNMFEKVKSQKREVAVAAVVDSVCQVCRMGIPPQMFNELLRMDSVRQCPNCQRIIYPKSLIEPEESE